MLFLQKRIIMIVLSTREFRSNQGRALKQAINGEDVILTSRYGTFRLTPVTHEDKLIPLMKSQVKNWFSQAEAIKTGNIDCLNEEEFWNELQS